MLLCGKTYAFTGKKDSFYSPFSASLKGCKEPQNRNMLIVSCLQKFARFVNLRPVENLLRKIARKWAYENRKCKQNGYFRSKVSVSRDLLCVI